MTLAIALLKWKLLWECEGSFPHTFFHSRASLLARNLASLCFGHEPKARVATRNILIWDQFYEVTLDIVRLLREMCNGNIYILVAIDHYSKWCKAKTIVDHDAKIVARFLENEIIYRFGMLKYNIINNGFKWVVEFD